MQAFYSASLDQIILICRKGPDVGDRFLLVHNASQYNLNNHVNTFKKMYLCGSKNHSESEQKPPIFLYSRVRCRIAEYFTGIINSQFMVCDVGRPAKFGAGLVSGKQRTWYFKPEFASLAEASFTYLAEAEI